MLLSHTVAGYVLAMLNFQDHVSVTIETVSFASLTQVRQDRTRCADAHVHSPRSRMVSVASSCGCTALLNSSHLNETIRARQRPGPGHDSDRADMVCHYRELLRSSTPVTLSLSYPETGNIQRAEEYSADSLIPPESSSCDVHSTESGSLFNLAACQPVQCNAMPQMNKNNPLFQVEWMVIRLMEHRVVTHHSLRLVRVRFMGLS